jgi:hypothetical protein
MVPDLATLIDLKRYPLMSLDGASGQAKFDQYNMTLETDGVCVLPGFVQASTVSTMLHEVVPCCPTQFLVMLVDRSMDGWATRVFPRRIQGG